MLTSLLTEPDHDGTFGPLRFPPFHHEMLSQDYWYPADEMGRIKIIIAEGLRDDSLAGCFKRVKSIVSFSFQHVPLGIC